MYVCIYVCMYVCIVLHRIVLPIVPDTIDHAFDACPAWQQTLHGALNLLSAVNVSTSHLTLLHPLDLLQTRECLVHFFALLIATFWRHRKKVPPHALLASFKWQLKHHIRLQWIANKKTKFKRFWAPFVTESDQTIVFHSCLGP